jgi:hypothetical protein
LILPFNSSTRAATFTNVRLIASKVAPRQRRLAAEHEARRGAVLQELQTLAGRLFVLPGPREQVAALEEAPQEESTRETGQIVRRGDWRQAAASIQEELSHHLKIRAG